ncbi:MAG: hypothetical protein RIR96_75 [Bacteroidota bacterium]
MKNLMLGVLLTLQLSAISQQLISPDEYLGHALGSAYTPHHKIVSYFKSIVASTPLRSKLFEYGKTNEGKPLMVLAISSESNIANIEEIRKNSLRFTGMLTDKSPDYSMPAIVWLSYNVHGNEPSSSEVAMKMAHGLVANTDSRFSSWLKNTVVLIDPCLNPDGRDRYVNWFNSQLGSMPDATPWSREHDEPWPGGRSNHYYFDLNRDWAWQTQVETKQRMELYHQWMPSIHVDFHEQYPENPYYFAPAAEPYHQAISEWQRRFQQTIGKNHAGYFDQFGWLYFTKEIFDLFYPAYGDTYPIFSGAVGMTYEQAGHSPGGLSIEVKGDTLSLKDRIEHHFTTSLSTIEVVSKNAKEVNKAFADYFSNTIKSGSGIYHSYLIKNENPDKIKTIMKLLDANKISYGKIKQTANFKGYHYSTGKDEGVSAGESDLIVTTHQPKGILARVLLEPHAQLADTLTYDITAWSLAYAHGLDVYALKENPAIIEMKMNMAENTVSAASYGYLMNYQSHDDAIMLSELLKMGAHVRYSEKSFETGGKKWGRGTLILLRHENKKGFDQLLSFMQTHSDKFSELSSGMVDVGFDMGSEKIREIKAPKVALITGSSMSPYAIGEIWHWMNSSLKYPVSLLNSDRVDESVLDEIQVLIAPDGRFKMLAEKESALKNWVKKGGKLIVMEGSLSQLASGDWGVKLRKEKENTDSKSENSSFTPRYENRERDQIVGNSPGAVFSIDMDESHPLAFGYQNRYYSLKQNDLLMDYTKEGWNVGVLKQCQPVSGFVGSAAKNKLQDGVVISVNDFGNGKLICFADNPIFRSFWENGKLMLANAIFIVR